jgi:hypothetical protein
LNWRSISWMFPVHLHSQIGSSWSSTSFSSPWYRSSSSSSSSAAAVEWSARFFLSRLSVSGIPWALAIDFSRLSFSRNCRRSSSNSRRYSTAYNPVPSDQPSPENSVKCVCVWRHTFGEDDGFGSRAWASEFQGFSSIPFAFGSSRVGWVFGGMGVFLGRRVLLRSSRDHRLLVTPLSFTRFCKRARPSGSDRRGP